MRIITNHFLKGSYVYYQGNFAALSDSYKVSHFNQYPEGTERVYSYFESRGGKFPETVFFGLQAILKEYFEGRIILNGDNEDVKELVDQHVGPGIFNYDGWEHILHAHAGMLPISIRAVPEGMAVPVRNVLMTVENTCPECYWLTNYVETLLVQTWYPTTVATLSGQIRKLILKHLEATGDPRLIDFKLHDFGFRGVSSVESAGIGGLAHLVHFKGTDTMAALLAAKEYYHSECAGFSIPAAEHSTITSWGEENEELAFANMLDRYPTGMVAVVSDSYDIYNACKNLWGGKLRDKVLARDGTLIIRPDSGYAPDVIQQCIQILDDCFGSTVNEKGYRILNPKVRLIQGDGVDYDMIDRILTRLRIFKYSADNIAFGMGGALLQKLNRDTNSFAFKCASVTVNGVERDVMKRPITDAGKESKKGRLKLIKVGGKFETVGANVPGNDYLVEVFRDGNLLVNHELESIRERAAESC